MAASFSEPTMEGIYCRRWAEVLVQYGDETELLGDARSLQDSAGTSTTKSSYSSVSVHFGWLVVVSYMV